jgi:hypothetical protein
VRNGASVCTRVKVSPASQWHLAVFWTILLDLQNLLHENALIVNLESLVVKMFTIFCHVNELRTLSARPVQISVCFPPPCPALTDRRTQTVVCAVRTKCPDGGRTVPWFVRGPSLLRAEFDPRPFISLPQCQVRLPSLLRNEYHR